MPRRAEISKILVAGCCVVALLVFCAPARALSCVDSEPFSVSHASGWVHDELGTGWEGATVRVFGSRESSEKGEDWLAGATTDGEGFFSLPGLERGTYFFVVTFKPAKPARFIAKIGGRCKKKTCRPTIDVLVAGVSCSGATKLKGTPWNPKKGGSNAPSH